MSSWGTAQAGSADQDPPFDATAWVVADEGWWGGDTETDEQLLSRMRRLSPMRAELVALRHPRLIRPRDPSGRTAPSHPGAEVISELRATMYGGTRLWPIGYGPLDVLMTRVERRMITAEQAATRAIDVGHRGDLPSPYARALAQVASRLSLRADDPSPMVLSDLVLAAATAYTGPDDPDLGGWSPWRWAAGAWLEVRTTRLIRVPDSATFAAALSLSEEVTRWASTRGVSEQTRALGAHGRLHLDPFAAEQSLGSLKGYRRVAERHAEAARRAGGDGQLPDPVEALHIARASFERLLELDPRAPTVNWKSLVQTLHALSVLDPRADDHRVREVAREALAYLDPQHDGDKIPYVQMLADRSHRSISSPPEPTDPFAPDRVAATTSPRQAVFGGMAAVKGLLEQAPSAADDLLEQMWSVAVDARDEQLRLAVVTGWILRFEATLDAARVNAEDNFSKRTGELRRAVGSWPVGERAAAMLGLAVASNRSDDEHWAVPIATEARALDVNARPGRRTATMFVQAQLVYGSACNLGSAGRIAAALTSYADAADHYLDCGFPSAAVHCLQRYTASVSVDNEIYSGGIPQLRTRALRWERELGASATELIADAVRVGSRHLTTRSDPNVLVARDQLAKGLRLTSAVASPEPISLTPAARRTLVEIDTASQRVDRTGVETQAGDAARDERMLLAYVSPSEMSPGLTPAQIELNLRRSFDDQLATQLYAAGGDPGVRSVEDIQDLLKPGSALISLFLGQHVEGRFAIHATAVSTSRVVATTVAQGFDEPRVETGVGGVTLTQSTIASAVAQMRRDIMSEPPMWGEASAEAMEFVDHGLRSWFGSLCDLLPEWREQGLHHLVVWPQGPLHFVPWSLFALPSTGRRLLDDWTVTTIPTLAVLGRPRAARRTQLLSVGCAESGTAFGLPAVPSMPRQADAVARAFGCSAMPEASASVERVVARMAHARYIHICSHGSHLIEAPAFQCIHLTSDETSDGRLFAHRVSTLDLRGVELVTLSACETALGRFDLGDNVRGLPAAFLAAGAAAVVGALWPVEEATATTFFVTMYGCLAADGARLNAFRTAQLRTRELHPEFRDWGAFTYTGDWDR